MPLEIFVDTSSIEAALECIENSQVFLDELKGELAAKVQYRMVMNAPKRTWFLAHSIRIEWLEDGFAVGPTAPYTIFVERGTGLFGPKKSLIFPKKAKVLRWYSFGKPVFAAYIKGQPGQWFIKKTDEEVFGEACELADRLVVEHFIVKVETFMRRGKEVTVRRGRGGRFV